MTTLKNKINRIAENIKRTLDITDLYLSIKDVNFLIKISDNINQLDIVIQNYIEN